MKTRAERLTEYKTYLSDANSSDEALALHLKMIALEQKEEELDLKKRGLKALELIQQTLVTRF